MKLLYSFYLLAYIIINPSIFYSFYDFYGDISLQYEVKFEGDMILKSDLFTYTNKNASFTFDYSVITRSQYTDKEYVIVDWFFTSLRNSNLPRIFHTLWDSTREFSKNNFIYSVLTSNDQFLVFDNKGKKSVLGYLFEQFFPIINTITYETKHSYKIEVPSGTQNADTYLMNIHGWNITKKNIQHLNPSFLSKEKDQQFISDLYILYSDSVKQSDSLFWIQELEISRMSVYNNKKGHFTLVGLYLIDLPTKQIRIAKWTGNTSFQLMYGQGNFNIPVDISTEGQWTIKLKKK